MKPLRLKKIKLPLTTLWAMLEERRSALLLLGLFLNEANWRRKLLVKAVRALPGELVQRPLTPEEEANHALTMLMMTTLVGKIWEGWDLISRGEKLRPTLEGLSLPSEVKNLEAQLKQELSKDLFVRIRNNPAFHYPERILDFSKLETHLIEQNARIYLTEAGYTGDVLSHLSTLASIEPLLAADSSPDWRIAFEQVLAEVMDVTQLYRAFVYGSLSILIQQTFQVSRKAITIPDAPKDEVELTRLFVHPPSDLEEMRNTAAPPIS